MKATQFNYQLQGVVAHIGTDATSGHYVTFIGTSKGWNLFDDSNIRQVSETEVFKHDAYILFYQKHNDNNIFIAQVILARQPKCKYVYVSINLHSMQTSNGYAYI